jgi:Predicted nucleotide-binding protein containing TIR-like domain
MSFRVEFLAQPNPIPHSIYGLGDALPLEASDEMGFFFGSLGRERVCAVYEEVEKPSDLGGILYVQYDTAEKWRYEVAKEILAAG